VDGLGLHDVTFIKIDVDGHEVPVLHGAAETIKRDWPRLLVEVEQRIQLVTDVIGLVESWGYRGWILLGRCARRMSARGVPLRPCTYRTLR
jgi:hypothetical protein